MADNYWTRTVRNRPSRRTALRTGGAATAGLAGLALVGCGDDDDGGDADPSASISQPTTDTSARPKRGGLYRWAWQGTPHLDIHQDSIAGATAIITATYNRVMRFEDQVQLPARKSPCLSGGNIGLECCRHNSADTLSAY